MAVLGMVEKQESYQVLLEPSEPRIYHDGNDLWEEVDLNQMRPTWAMYFLKSLQIYSLGFHVMIWYYF